MQKLLQNSNQDSVVYQQEKSCISELRKWLFVEVTALRQKSRIQWLQSGDSNQSFFFNSMKERHRINRISVLYNDQGERLLDADDIHREVFGFYKGLFGSSAASLPGIHLPIIRSGPRLNIPAREALCQMVTEAEMGLNILFPLDLKSKFIRSNTIMQKFHQIFYQMFTLYFRKPKKITTRMNTNYRSRYPDETRN